MASQDKHHTERNRSFDARYEGTPPWDIGRPQPFVEEAIARGELTGRVLDVGCGTGENALAVAAAGADVTGIDVSRRAIEKAHSKAAERGIHARFQVEDVFRYTPDQPFDAAIDSGVYHIFPDDDRARYVTQLRSWLRPGGLLLLACFSDKEPTDWGGPRRITRAELEDSFADWSQLDIQPGRFGVTMPEVTGHAWTVRARA